MNIKSIWHDNLEHRFYSVQLGEVICLKWMEIEQMSSTKLNSFKCWTFLYYCHTFVYILDVIVKWHFCSSINKFTCSFLSFMLTEGLIMFANQLLSIIANILYSV